jgi:DNA-binding NarL/FixJ family response regulator
VRTITPPNGEAEPLSRQDSTSVGAEARLQSTSGQNAATGVLQQLTVIIDGAADLPNTLLEEGHLSTRIRILVVDDHQVLRDGLAALISLESDMVLAGQAESGSTGVKMYRELQPDVTLMDINMPGMTGIEAVSLIRGEAPDARIMMLTTYRGDAQAVRALKAGAVGYLLKNTARAELVAAIRVVHQGRRYIPLDVADEMAEHINDEALTEREVRVLKSIAQGNSNKEAAAELNLSMETVKTQLKTILAKLDAKDRTHAVAIAIRRGIIDA